MGWWVHNLFLMKKQMPEIILIVPVTSSYLEHPSAKFKKMCPPYHIKNSKTRVQTVWI